MQSFTFANSGFGNMQQDALRRLAEQQQAETSVPQAHSASATGGKPVFASMSGTQGSSHQHTPPLPRPSFEVVDSPIKSVDYAPPQAEEELDELASDTDNTVNVSLQVPGEHAGAVVGATTSSNDKKRKRSITPTTTMCGECHQIGHRANNSKCPKYAERMVRVQQKERDALQARLRAEEEAAQLQRTASSAAIPLPSLPSQPRGERLTTPPLPTIGLTDMEHAAVKNILDGLSDDRQKKDRLVPEFFTDMPDVKQNADYYEQIVSPRSLSGIKRAHLERRYSSQQQVYSDLKLVAFNGLQYFDESTNGYRAAHRLLDRIDKLWDAQFPDLLETLDPPLKDASIGSRHEPQTDAIHAYYLRKGISKALPRSMFVQRASTVDRTSSPAPTPVPEQPVMKTSESSPPIASTSRLPPLASVEPLPIPTKSPRSSPVMYDLTDLPSSPLPEEAEASRRAKSQSSPPQNVSPARRQQIPVEHQATPAREAPAEPDNATASHSTSPFDATFLTEPHHIRPLAFAPKPRAASPLHNAASNAQQSDEPMVDPMDIDPAAFDMSQFIDLSPHRKGTALAEVVPSETVSTQKFANIAPSSASPEPESLAVEQPSVQANRTISIADQLAQEGDTSGVDDVSRHPSRISSRDDLQSLNPKPPSTMLEAPASVSAKIFKSPFAAGSYQSDKPYPPVRVQTIAQNNESGAEGDAEESDVPTPAIDKGKSPERSPAQYSASSKSPAKSQTSVNSPSPAKPRWKPPVSLKKDGQAGKSQDYFFFSPSRRAVVPLSQMPGLPVQTEPATKGDTAGSDSDSDIELLPSRPAMMVASPVNEEPLLPDREVPGVGEAAQQNSPIKKSPTKSAEAMLSPTSARHASDPDRPVKKRKLGLLPPGRRPTPEGGYEYEEPYDLGPPGKAPTVRIQICKSKTGPSLITILRSDGHRQNWPDCNNQVGIDKQGQVDFFCRTPDNSEHARSWRRTIGMELADFWDLSPKKDRLEWSLSAWPSGYRLFEHHKGPQRRPNIEYYLYGSNFARNWNAPRKALEHLNMLVKYDTHPCSCEGCRARMGAWVHVPPLPSNAKRSSESLMLTSVVATALKPHITATAAYTYTHQQGFQKTEKQGPPIEASRRRAAEAVRLKLSEQAILYKGPYINKERQDDLARAVSTSYLRQGELVWARIKSLNSAETDDVQILYWPGIVIDRRLINKPHMKANSRPAIGKPPLDNAYKIVQTLEWNIALFGIEEKLWRSNSETLPWLGHHQPLSIHQVVPDPDAAAKIWNPAKRNIVRASLRKLQTVEMAIAAFSLALEASASVFGSWNYCDRYVTTEITAEESGRTSRRDSGDKEIANYQAVYLGGERIWVGDMVRLMNVLEGRDSVVVPPATKRRDGSKVENSERSLILKINSIYRHGRTDSPRVSGSIYEIHDPKEVEEPEDEVSVQPGERFMPSPPPLHKFRLLTAVDCEHHLDMTCVAGRYYQANLLYPLPPNEDVPEKDLVDDDGNLLLLPFDETRCKALSGLQPINTLYTQFSRWEESRQDAVVSAEKTANNEVKAFYYGKT